MDSSENKKNLKKRIFKTIIVSLLLPCLLCIVTPFEIYCNNMNEFIFTMSQFLPVCIGIAIVMATIIFFSIFFLPNRAYKICMATLISLALLVFLQSNYLNSGISSLSGDNLGTIEIQTHLILINLFVWLIVIGGAIGLTFIKDKLGIVSIISLLICLIVACTQLVTPITMCITYKDELFKKNEFSVEDNITNKILTTKNLDTLSANSNIYYFCIDRFDEFYAEHAYENNKNIFDNFTGFTWFQDNISNYGHTYPAIVNMLTNKEYDIEKSRAEFLNSAYNENTPLQALYENGYDINIYSQSYYAYTNAGYLPEYIQNSAEKTKVKITSHLGLSFSMIQMSLFRHCPLILKNTFGKITSSTCNDYIENSGKDSFKEFSLKVSSLNNYLSSSDFNTTEGKSFKFIHTEGNHDIIYNKTWNNPDTLSSSIITKSVEENIKIINKYISELKENGLYEDATIIVTGDHPHPINDYTELKDIRLTALFVKPAGSSSEPLKISQAQTSHQNIWGTIFQSASISNELELEKSVFDIPEDEDQTRTYTWHTYANDLDEYSYEISGSGRNFQNWKLTNTKHYDKFIMD